MPKGGKEESQNFLFNDFWLQGRKSIRAKKQQSRGGRLFLQKKQFLGPVAQNTLRLLHQHHLQCNVNVFLFDFACRETIETPNAERIDNGPEMIGRAIWKGASVARPFEDACTVGQSLLEAGKSGFSGDGPCRVNVTLNAAKAANKAWLFVSPSMQKHASKVSINILQCVCAKKDWDISPTKK